ERVVSTANPLLRSVEPCAGMLPSPIACICVSMNSGRAPKFLLAVYWRFWQGQLLPYAPQAKRALYAKPATTLFLKALRQVVDSTAGDVVQLVRTLPCRWLESCTVTAKPRSASSLPP